jgi:hypothetical protein
MEAWGGGLSDEEHDARFEGHAEHFKAIRDQLPSSLVWLYETHGLHDGRLLELKCDPETSSALMVVDAWNDFNGDFEVNYRLEFGGVGAVDLEARVLNDRCGASGLGDLGYFEIDILADGLYRIDFLFWSGMEVGVTFETLSITTDPADFYSAG